MGVNEEIKKDIVQVGSIDTSSQYYMFIARKILAENVLFYNQGVFYKYNKGVYLPLPEKAIERLVMDIMQTRYNQRAANQTIHNMQVLCSIPEEKLNQSEKINLKNGMYDLKTSQIEEHNPSFLSTIQVDMKYHEDSLCPKWLKFINEVLENDHTKARVLQEYFGLCLTKETKYEKCLMLVGEGSNGKSVITYILHSLIGSENTTAIPLESFRYDHYIAALFSKLVNISSENKTKENVYDSVFKAIISGDEIQASKKYFNSFKFKPFCKLVINLNDLPRVEDKSHGFFRRLLIIRFNRIFKEIDQNKNLKKELSEELDGIFLWALAGLKNLQQRGYFTITESMQREISRYRTSNNNVRLYIDDCCVIDGMSTISLKDLYNDYKSWCDEAGLRHSGKQNFNEELSRYKGNEVKRYKSGVFCWRGIRTISEI